MLWMSPDSSFCRGSQVDQMLLENICQECNKCYQIVNSAGQSLQTRCYWKTYRKDVTNVTRYVASVGQPQQTRCYKKIYMKDVTNVTIVASVGQPQQTRCYKKTYIKDVTNVTRQQLLQDSPSILDVTGDHISRMKYMLPDNSLCRAALVYQMLLENICQGCNKCYQLLASVGQQQQTRYYYSINDLIKQIFVFDTALVITNI